MIALALAATLASAVPAGAVPEARLLTTTCADTIAETTARCGTLVVPERRDGRSREVIQLPFVILAAQGERKAGPIAYLPGGPGASTLGLYLPILARASELRRTGDIVLLEQRGTAQARPALFCDDANNYQIFLRLEPVRHCRARLIAQRVDLSAYDSAASAADWEDLRRLLGIERWNLLGRSYGTRLALSIMRDFPGGVRSAVLDSGYPPDVEPFTGNARSPLDALSKIFDGCALDTACAAAFPRLRARFIALIEALDRKPRQVGRDRVDAQIFLGLVTNRLASASGPSFVPAALHAATTDRFEAAVRWLSSGGPISHVSNDRATSDAVGLSLSVECRERLPLAPDERSALGTREAWTPSVERAARGYWRQFRAACAIWRPGTAPLSETRPVSSTIPTLLIAGEFDPVSPPDWTERAAASLTGATLMSVPGAGHGAGTLPCPREVTARFIDHPNTTPDMACLAPLYPPRFVTNLSFLNP